MSLSATRRVHVWSWNTATLTAEERHSWARVSTSEQQHYDISNSHSSSYCVPPVMQLLCLIRRCAGWWNGVAGSSAGHYHWTWTNAPYEKLKKLSCPFFTSSYRLCPWEKFGKWWPVCVFRMERRDGYEETFFPQMISFMHSCLGWGLPSDSCLNSNLCLCQTPSSWRDGFDDTRAIP